MSRFFMGMYADNNDRVVWTRLQRITYAVEEVIKCGVL
ncbi:hypothetical protein I314_06499, partial [Cryptococcus bacillisporus CA1873]